MNKFIEFARQTNLFITIASLLLLTYAVTVGANNVKRIALLEVFSEEDVKRIEARKEIAKIIPELFTAEFYRLNESEQLKKIDEFYMDRIADIEKKMAIEDWDTKEKLIQAVHRLNTSPQEQPEQK